MAGRTNYWQHGFAETDSFRDRTRAGHSADEPEAGDECSRLAYCSGRRIVVEDGERKVIAARTYGAFCSACRLLIASCLSELPAAYVRLAGEIGEPSSQHAGVRTPFGPRLPLRADVDELMRAIAEVLASWSERVRSTARLSVLDTRLSRLRSQAAAVADYTRLLEAHLTVLLALGPEPMVRAVRAYSAEDEITLLELSGQQAGEEILRLHRSALLILGEIVPQREKLDGIPCKRCEEFALERAEPPSDKSKEAMWSRCASCSDMMSRAHYDDWSKWYGAWADGLALSCRRCALDRHEECEYERCGCADAGHDAAPLSA